MFLYPRTDNIGLLSEGPPEPLVVLLFEHFGVESLISRRHQLLHLRPLYVYSVALTSADKRISLLRYQHLIHVGRPSRHVQSVQRAELRPQLAQDIAMAITRNCAG